MDNLIDKIITAVPRKMVIGIFVIWMIADYSKAKEVNPLWALGSMTVIGLASIGTHFWLEYKHPTNGAK